MRITIFLVQRGKPFDNNAPFNNVKLGSEPSCQRGRTRSWKLAQWIQVKAFYTANYEEEKAKEGCISEHLRVRQAWVSTESNHCR